MHAGKGDLPVVAEFPGFESRQAEWDGFTAAIETVGAGLDATELFADLPGGMCQAQHWGYVVKGRLKVKYADRDEVVNEGELYYLPPGHIPSTDVDTVLVEFSPAHADYEQTLSLAEKVSS